jgi:hypothetical protein
MAALRRQRPNMTLQIEEAVTWATVSRSDAVFMQRPCLKQQRQIADMVALDHPGFARYMHEDCHEVLRHVLGLADIVTVSTHELKRLYGQYARDVRRVPNALMTSMLGPLPIRDLPRANTVMWRGSATHQRDLDIYTPEIVELAKRHPDVGWRFLGFATYQLLEQIGPQATKADMMDQIYYFAHLPMFRPRLLMVPLADHPFNRGKSNIAGLEATWAGAVPVVPNWDEWQIPGWIRYDAGGFTAAMEKALALTDDELRNRYQESRQYIERNLTIDVVNQQRAAAVDDMQKMAVDPFFKQQRRLRVQPKIEAA